MKRRAVLAGITTICLQRASFAEPAPMVFFAADSAELSLQANVTLKQLGNECRFRPRPVRISIWGHADRSEHDRMTLSLRRASGVMQALLKGGCPPDFMTVIGYGDERPLIQTPEGVGEAQNRRVEIVTYQ